MLARNDAFYSCHHAFQTTLKMLRYYLTVMTFCHRLLGMSHYLGILEKRLEQFLAYCEGLRAENRALRQQVAGLENDCKSLAEKIDTARHRLEALMQKIPVE